MNYTVDFDNAADGHLARAWTIATDQDAISAAAMRIEDMLTRDPKNAGSEVSEGLWRIEAPPLAATFEIDDDAKKILVTSFYRIN